MDFRMKRKRLKLLLLIFLVILTWYLTQHLWFASAVTSASTLVLHEGLPRRFERDTLQQELGTKPTRIIHGYNFYQLQPQVDDADVQTLKRILSSSATYEWWLGPTLCGGFHPDYALEWETQRTSYYALLCFGCMEVKVRGPVAWNLYSLSDESAEELKTLLDKYRTSRPKGSRQSEESD